MSKTFGAIEVGGEQGVLTITLNRPQAYNAFNEQMLVELGSALRAAQRDDSVRCIVLTGAGKAFGAGQDLVEIKDRYTGEPSARAVDFGAHLRLRYNPVVSRLRSIEKPVLAAVNGVAAGAGASFAFACDLRLCARSASFVMAFVNIGLVPDSGATLALLQHVGYSRAFELCVLGDKLGADEALRCGLANHVVDDEQFAGAVREMAARLAALPTRAIGLTKRALSRAWLADFDDQLEYEAFMQQTAGHTSDHREGVRAFIEKRKPHFRGV